MLTKLMNWEIAMWNWQINFYENYPMILATLNVLAVIVLIVTIIWAIIEFRKFNKEINKSEQNEI